MVVSNNNTVDAMRLLKAGLNLNKNKTSELRIMSNVVLDKKTLVCKPVFAPGELDDIDTWKTAYDMAARYIISIIDEDEALKYEDVESALDILSFICGIERENIELFVKEALSLLFVKKEADVAANIRRYLGDGVTFEKIKAFTEN